MLGYMSRLNITIIHGAHWSATAEVAGVSTMCDGNLERTSLFSATAVTQNTANYDNIFFDAVIYLGVCGKIPGLRALPAAFTGPRPTLRHPKQTKSEIRERPRGQAASMRSRTLTTRPEPAFYGA